MSLFAFTITIAKELLPFLKEALLEGQSFRVWLRSNWLTFIFLLTTLAMTLMVAYLSDLIRAQKERELQLRADIVALAKPAETLMTQYQQLKADKRDLEAQVEQLQKDNQDSLEMIEQHLTWMERCGVNVETGQCRVSRAPVRSRRPQQKPEQTPPPEEPEAREGFFRRLRDLLTRNSPEDR